MAIVSLLVTVLATYRLAHLLPEDDGPFFIFKRIHKFTTTKMMNENDELGFWAMIDNGINCACCCGLYMAILTGYLTIWPTAYGNIFLVIFAIAGGQSLLQKLGDK